MKIKRALRNFLIPSIVFTLAMAVVPANQNFSLAATSYTIMGSIQGHTLANDTSLSSIKLEQLTHLIYSGMHVTSSSDPTLINGFSMTQISDCVTAGHNKGIKVLVSLAGTTELYPILSSSSLRAQLVSNISSLLTTYNADGIDIDWEEDNWESDHQAVFDQFVFDLYTVLHPIGKIITIYAYRYNLYDISVSASQYVSFIQIVGSYFPTIPVTGIIDILPDVNNWVNAGYTTSKLLICIPFYSKDAAWHEICSYANIVNVVNPIPDQNTITGLTSISPGFNPPSTSISGTLSWNGINLVKAKVDYVKANGLGGVQCFDIGQDKLNDSSSLLQNIYDEMNSNNLISPTVTTNSASSITTTGAKLNASLTNLGTASSVTASFEYGLTTSYGSTIDGVPALLTSTGTFSASPTGLSANTTYHYRAVAVGDGTTYGSDQTFTTLSPLTISTSSMADGNVNVAYSQTLYASGGTTPYIWSLYSGSLPTGLTISSGGVVSGTPTTAGTSSFTVKVTDNAAVTATKSLSITISSGPSITTSSLADGQVNTAYSQTLSASGGATPYTWSLSSGSSLPTGLTLSSGGIISGTPTIAGISSFTVMVSDSAGQSTTKTLSITVTSVYDAWDVNMDGVTNILDMILVGQHIGETGTAGWIAEDVNADGVINVLDDILIGQHFGE